jgi:hypothetical protein
MILVCFGSVLYWAFGDQAADIALLQLPSDSWFTALVQGAYSLAIYASFPLQVTALLMAFAYTPPSRSTVFATSASFRLARPLARSRLARRWSPVVPIGSGY